MKILLLCDDHAHPGQIPTAGVAPLRQKGCDIDIITDGAQFDSALLRSYTVIMISKSDSRSHQDHTPWQTPFAQDAFISYVENGGGLLAVHSGTVGGKDTARLDALIGGKFLRHPAQCPVTVEALKPHPITQGVSAFTEIDEHYYLNIIDAGVDIFLAAYAPAMGDPALYETQPYTNAPAGIRAAGYTRTQGHGRVCALTPGHNLAVWHHPSFQRLLENALGWCAGEKFE